MNKITKDEVIKAYSAILNLCVSNYEYIDNNEAERIDKCLDILYKQLFEEGDR